MKNHYWMRIYIYIFFGVLLRVGKNKFAFDQSMAWPNSWVQVWKIGNSPKKEKEKKYGS